MIIQVRGTSGSGKSTVVRRFMETAEWESVFLKGRKKALYYRSLNIPCGVVVLGHYESPCGGGDTIGSARAIAELIETVRKDDSNRVIVVEGLLLSEDVKWTSQMPDVRCLFLTTDVEECLIRVRGRRAEVGNEKPLNESNTRGRVAVIERARLKLLDLGVECRRCSSDVAPGMILNWVTGVQLCKTRQPG